MKGENKHPIQIRAKEMSRRENSFASEEIYGSGGFSYRFLWDWAKLPPEIKGFEICGVCCDKDGYVYIATRAPGYPVAVFSPGGEWVRYIGQEVETGSPHGIYIDEEFHIWLTDRDRHVAYEWDQDGRLLRMLGKYGCPSDTGVNDTVRDTRLIFYTEKRLGEPFNQPTRIVRAPNGDLYASDGYANTAVHHFSQDGKLLNSWGGLGTEPGKFGIVHSVWADRLGRVWIADREFDRVQVFDGEGHLIKVIDNLLYPTDVTADDHYIYIAEREGRISIYNYDLQLTAQIGYWLSSIIPHSMAVDHNGNLFLGQLWGNYNLVKLERQ